MFRHGHNYILPRKVPISAASGKTGTVSTVGVIGNYC